jgi:hypothetical protein
VRYLSCMMRHFLGQCNEICHILMRYFLGQCNEISVIYDAQLLGQCNEISVIYLCATSRDSVMRYLSYTLRHFLGQWM